MSRFRVWRFSDRRFIWNGCESGGRHVLEPNHRKLEAIHRHCCVPPKHSGRDQSRTRQVKPRRRLLQRQIPGGAIAALCPRQPPRTKRFLAALELLAIASNPTMAILADRTPNGAEKSRYDAVRRLSRSTTPAIGFAFRRFGAASPQCPRAPATASTRNPPPSGSGPWRGDAAAAR